MRSPVRFAASGALRRAGYRRRLRRQPVAPAGQALKATTPLFRLLLICSLWTGLAPAGTNASDSYRIESGDAASWAQVLAPFGLVPAATANIIVMEGATATAVAAANTTGNTNSPAGAATTATARATARANALRATATHAVRDTGKRVTVRNVELTQRPTLEVIWEKEIETPIFELPAAARIFARDRWTGAPLVAGWKDAGHIRLWTALSPGAKGYDRFPYLPQVLAELGWDPPYRGNRLWAFFDAGYRSRADLDFLAARWRKAGIAGLHVAAWHYFDGGAAKAADLERLIEACHKQRILVYAWLELPHVSEKFWHDHPEWREKTALLADAHLDWRKLMNLRNRDCFAAVSRGVRDLLARFDWDGVNLAELYFESLEGVANPARLTPMNDDIRAEFRAQHGFDPLEFFQGARRAGTKLFTDYRADLAARMQREWLDVLAGIRRAKPHLDLVWTHIDDRYDPRMRELLGADTSRVMPLLGKYDATLLVEDPATVWHLGPRRYLDIGEKYGRNPRVAIDINIVDRYQDVYPTKQQTGVELFQLVHFAGQGFGRVALYFENSILPIDYPLLAAATSPGVKVDGAKLTASHPFGLRLAGTPIVDGKPWPVRANGTVWLPAGTRTVTTGANAVSLPILDLNAELEKASATEAATEITYRSSSRALVLVPVMPKTVEVDGHPITPRFWPAPDGVVLELPPGQHRVKLTAPSVDKIT